MNVLALDFGLQRIGVAVGSTESGVAFGRPFLMNNVGIFEKIGRIVEQEKIAEIVVGEPWKLDRNSGDIAGQLDVFIQELEDKFGLPIKRYDERFSSKIAQGKLREVKISAKDQKMEIDSMAAQVILQEYLDVN